jgi:hypothetical protein
MDLEKLAASRVVVAIPPAFPILEPGGRKIFLVKILQSISINFYNITKDIPFLCYILTNSK